MVSARASSSSLWVSLGWENNHSIINSMLFTPACRGASSVLNLGKPISTIIEICLIWKGTSYLSACIAFDIFHFNSQINVLNYRNDFRNEIITIINKLWVHPNWKHYLQHHGLEDLYKCPSIPRKRNITND